MWKRSPFTLTDSTFSPSKWKANDTSSILCRPDLQRIELVSLERVAPELLKDLIFDLCELMVSVTVLGVAVLDGRERIYPLDHLTDILSGELFLLSRHAGRLRHLSGVGGMGCTVVSIGLQRSGVPGTMVFDTRGVEVRGGCPRFQARAASCSEYLRRR